MKRVLSCFALSTLVIAGVAAVVQALPVNPIQITITSPGHQEGPIGLNDSKMMVWDGWDGNDREIYLYDRATKTTKNISQSDGIDDLGPVINNKGEVAWYDITGNIYLYYNSGIGGWVKKKISNPTMHGTAFKPVINDNGDVAYPAYGRNLSGTYKGNEDIFVYDKSSDKLVAITNDTARKSHVVMNNKGDLVWHGDDLATTSPDYEIFYCPYDTVLIKGGAVANISNSVNKIDWFPRVSDTGWVVWEGEDTNGTDFEIYRYSLTSGPKQNITNNTTDDIMADVNTSGEVVFQNMGDGIKFYEWRNNTWTMVLISNLLFSTNCDITNKDAKGNTWLIWDQFDNYDDEIMMWSRGLVSLKEQITDNNFNDNNPILNNIGDAAWNGQVNGLTGKYEIFLGEKCADNDNDGYTICDNDCNDADPKINPGALEICDGIDNNCSGTIDEYKAEYHEDKDKDNEGCDPGSATNVCAPSITQCYNQGTTPPSSITSGNNTYVWNKTDCNDNDLNINTAKGNCGSVFYFPSIKDDDAVGWANFLTVQAKDPVSMDVSISVYNLSGGLMGTYIYSNTDPGANAPAIAPYARVAQKPCLIASGSTTTCSKSVEGSVIIKTNVPAIANTNAISNFYEGFSIYEAAKPRAVHFFPKQYDGPNNYQVYLLVQNVYNTKRNVTIKLFGKTNTSPGHGLTMTTDIPAYGTLKVRPSDIAGGINFDGSSVVYSNLSAPEDGKGLPVPAMCRYELGKEAMTIYESTVPQPKLFFPVIKDGKFGTGMNFQNFLSVVNNNAIDATVTVVLYNKTGVEEGRDPNVVIPAGGKKTWLPSGIKGGSWLTPLDFEGSVVVTTTAPLIGQTNSIYPGVNAYNCDAFDLIESALPSITLSFPKAFDNLLGDNRMYDNYVYVQNTDNVKKTIKIEQFNNNGTANGVATVTVNPNAMHIYRPKDMVTDGTNQFRGSIRITETGGLTITGAIKYEIHSSATITSPIDAMTIYRSMGQ